MYNDNDIDYQQQKAMDGYMHCIVVSQILYHL